MSKEELSDEQVELLALWLVAAQKYPDMHLHEKAETVGKLFAALSEIRRKTKKGKTLIAALGAKVAA